MYTKYIMNSIKEIEAVPLDDTDIRKMLKGIKILVYPDLAKYTNIEDAFDSKGRLVLLYPTNGQYDGHWTCLIWHKKSNTIEFFDSYGLDVDTEKKWLTEAQLIEYHEDKPLLTNLLRKANENGKKIIHNHYQFQSFRNNNNDCGRFVVVRLLSKDMSLKAFKQMITDSGLSADDFVSKITFKLIGK